MDIKKQIEIYKEETEKKKVEETELTKVMNDYKTRFGEFDKSIKLSRKTMQQYEKEIVTMNRKINTLKD